MMMVVSMPTVVLVMIASVVILGNQFDVAWSDSVDCGLFAELNVGITVSELVLMN